VLGICREMQGSGIVYVTSRKDTESIAGLLRDNGVSAIAYHAGFDPDIRAANQDRFMSGKVRVVVATIAFGMGVDKANVRFIVHFNPPTSLEAYAQESGRAGRDGEPAKCVLLAVPNDETRLRRFARGDALNKDDLRLVYTNLKRYAAGRWVLLDRFDADSLSGSEEIDSRVALGLLDQAGLVSRHPDVPVTLNLRWNPDDRRLWEDGPDWQRFVEWLGPAAGRGAATVNVAEACRALDMAPLDLDRLLASRPGVRVHEGPRVVCIELLPAGSDAPQRVDALLAEVEKLADRRIRQVIAYAQRKQCRHVMLAAQFGEHLEPCGTSCDVCTGDVRVDDAPPGRDGKKRVAGVDDALNVLRAVKTLPFPMGRPGLVRLLLGSAESRVRKDRSAYFGALEGFTVSSAGRLVDRLTEQGYLFRDTDHEYNLISLTDKGRNVSAEDLAEEFVATGRRVGGQRASRNGDMPPDAPVDKELYDRLAEWRVARARQDQMPPYVFATNAMLESVASTRPRTLVQLENLPGFGRVKCEKYGEEILAVVNEGQ
jgi:ATP-dependent DNA helicase RecQ